MVLRSTGAAMLARLMRPEREACFEPWLETDWLLFGPEDPEVVEPREAPPACLLAAE